MYKNPELYQDLRLMGFTKSQALQILSESTELEEAGRAHRTGKCEVDVEYYQELANHL